MLSQIAFTTHTKEGLTLEDFKTTGVKNDTICKSLGFTGRIFANESEYFNIIEGEPERVQEYFSAFSNNWRNKLTIPHFHKEIKLREFSDYQVWGYHSKAGLNLPPEIHHLKRDTFESSIPPNISLGLRLLLEGYVFESVKKAA